MKLKIKNARLSFASLFKAYEPKTGKPKYSCKLICSPETVVEYTDSSGKQTIQGDDAGNMEMMFLELAIDRWGKKVAKVANYAYNKADGSTTREPYTDEEGQYRDGYTAGTWYFAANKYVEDAPGGVRVWDQNGKTRLDGNSGKPLAGDYVNAIIDAFPYEFEGKKGISASLEGVQYFREGEKFGSKAVNDDDWDDVTEDDEPDDWGDEEEADTSDCI